MGYGLVTATAVLLALVCTGEAPRHQRRTPRPRTPTARVLPSADQVLDRFVQAIGGEATHRRLTSRVSKGTFTSPDLPGLVGSFESYEKAPDKSVVTLTFPGLGAAREGYDGVVGWEQEPDGQVRGLRGAALAAARREADFYYYLNLKTLFPVRELKGLATVGGREAYILELTPTDGRPEKLYFSVETGLLLRMDSVEEEDSGETFPLEIYLDDYRTVDGVKLPFLARNNSPQARLTIKITEVRHNVPVDDSVFRKPLSRGVASTP